MYKIAFVITAAILILGVVSVTEAQAQSHIKKPQFTTGSYVARIDIKYENDCWDETYIRMADRDNNHRLLNKQYIYNDDKPDLGPSEVVYTNLKFKAENIKGESQRFRAYVIVDDGFDKDQEYKAFVPGQKYYHFHFHLQTNSEKCQTQ